MTVSADKAACRKRAFAARKAAHDAGLDRAAQERLLALLTPLPPGSVVGGYMPIRTEIDPRPVMAALHERGLVIGVPVIRGKGRPLVFSRWEPGCTLVEGPFGAAVPAEERLVRPGVLIVPLVAFDRQGHRLGYGGGFYDRTFAALGGPIGIGLAYGAQELPELPVEATDHPLDAVVTERETLRFRPLPFA